MPSDHDNLANHLALQRLRLSKSTNAQTPEQMATRSSEAAVIATRSLKLLAFLESSTVHEIETLDLSNSELSDEDYVIICVVIENHPTVRRLILEGNRLNEVSLQSIIRACRKNRFLAEIRVDRRQMALEGITELTQQLEANRSFIKQARRRQWLHVEKVNYTESVNSFCDFMREFFLREMKLRHDVEEQEAHRRKEIGELSQEHRRREIFRQRMKRIIEAVHERLLWVIEREAKFRSVLVAEWRSNNILLCLQAEVSLRDAAVLTEKRVRVETKTEETQGWVASRRREKKRLDDDLRAQMELLDRETAAREVLAVDGLDYYDRLAPVEAKRREDAQMSEFMRLERERREMVQRRKEAEQQRERREKEEKERQQKLARFLGEQRKEREKMDVDATVGRKRVMLLRATFLRFADSYWATFLQLAQLRDAAARQHQLLEEVLQTGFPPTLAIVIEESAAWKCTEGEQSPAPASPTGTTVSPLVPPAVAATLQINSDKWRSAVADAFQPFRSIIFNLRQICGSDFKSVSYLPEDAPSPMSPVAPVGIIKGAVASTAAGPGGAIEFPESSSATLEEHRDDEDKQRLQEEMESEQKALASSVRQSMKVLRFRKCRTAEELLSLWLPLAAAEVSASIIVSSPSALSAETGRFHAFVGGGDDDGLWKRRAQIEGSEMALSASFSCRGDGASSFAEQQSGTDLTTLDMVQSNLAAVLDAAVAQFKLRQQGIHREDDSIQLRCKLTFERESSVVECAASWPTMSS
jgi:hypothetical protein